MKKLAILTIFIICLQLFFVSAYNLQVETSSKTDIVLAITDIQTVDVKISNVYATAESPILSDTYLVDTSLRTEGDAVMIYIDISPIFQDYSSEEIQSILVSGILNLNGEQVEFGKRVSYRGNQVISNPNLAPILNLENDLAFVYWIISLAMILVLLILILFYTTPRIKSLPTNVLVKKPSRKKKVVRRVKKKSVKVKRKSHKSKP